MAPPIKPWATRLTHAIYDQLVTASDRQAGNAKVVLEQHTNECLARISDVTTPMGYEIHRRNGKRCFSLVDRYDRILDSTVASYLRDRLSLKPPNRNQIVKGLTALLPELGHATLYRFDIANFYESLNRDEILRQMMREANVGHVSAQWLERNRRTFHESGCDGLPRGVALSSVVSEWLLRELDAALQTDPAVYFYARFVDDIVLLVVSPEKTQPADTIENFLKTIPGGPRLNDSPKKRKAIEISEKANLPLLSEPFDFLGYRFSNAANSSYLRVDMSPAKASKLKTKLWKSCNDYCRDQNFTSLSTAFRFLSSNTALVRRGIAPRAMRTGIFYNYPAITHDTYLDGELRGIDIFLRALVLGHRTRVSRTLGTMLNPTEKRRLLRCSFVAGHRDRVFSGISRNKAKCLV